MTIANSGDALAGAGIAAVAGACAVGAGVTGINEAACPDTAAGIDTDKTDEAAAVASKQTSGQTAVLVVRLSYDGARFCGFAKQKDPDIRTVQECLEAALSTALRMEVSTVCCGRTDTGVHALDQYVSLQVPTSCLEGKSSYTLRKSLNALTDDDISVLGVGLATDPEFSARFSTLWREYRYRIVAGDVPPLFMRRFAWWHKGKLDVEAMRKAAQYLVGEHDFKSFCKAESAADKNTVREVKSIELLWEEHMGERCLVIKVVGNAFLHSMIRTIVGTLAEVGAGRRQPEWVGQVLAAQDRTKAGRNAPACGLVFHKVTYPSGFWHEF